MKFIYLLPILVFVYFNQAKAQDLIVTTKGDSLNCQITQVEEKFIHFKLQQGVEVKRILMSKEQIRYYEVGFYLKKKLTQQELAYSKIEDDYSNFRSKFKPTKFRIAANGGWSYLTAKLAGDAVPPEITKYYEELRTGYNLSIDAEYFIGKHFGFGLTYSIFKTKNSLQPVYVKNNTTGKIYSGVLQDDITIQYAGPVFFSRIFNKRKTTCFLPYVSIGYLDFRNNGILIDKLIMTGNTIGRKGGLVLEYYFADDFSMGVDFSFTSGILTEYTIESGGIKTEIKAKNAEEYSNISRLDLSAGIRYTF